VKALNGEGWGVKVQPSLAAGERRGGRRISVYQPTEGVVVAGGVAVVDGRGGGVDLAAWSNLLLGWLWGKEGGGCARGGKR